MAINEARRHKMYTNEMYDILALWAKMTGCAWTDVGNDIVLITGNGNLTYTTLKGAVLHCLYAIAELIGEA